MILDRVTFTGADDSVLPRDLEGLQREFPFVEWGILFSASNRDAEMQRKARFPSDNWIRRAARCGLRLSAHLCGGRYVRELMDAGATHWLHDYGSATRAFQRVQLNFHGQYHKVGEAGQAAIHALCSSWQVILQCDNVNDAHALALHAGYGTVPLFDTSGGAGVLPAAWPEAWHGVYCGYAGGLGADNVLAQLESISDAVPHDGRIWIDMERRVRSADDMTFNLQAVADVLAQVAPLVQVPV